MILKGIIIDFNDKKTCGLLPDKCLKWDEKSEDLQENTELINYFENNLKKVLAQTKNIVAGTIEHKSIVCSQDKNAIEIIDSVFEELELQEINFNEIVKNNSSLKHNYLV